MEATQTNDYVVAHITMVTYQHVGERAIITFSNGEMLDWPSSDLRGLAVGDIVSIAETAPPDEARCPVIQSIALGDRVIYERKAG